VFAVTSIEAWRKQVGEIRYPEAREIFITADAGGSNGHRPRVWKAELQRPADKLGLSIHVSHFPPGTSKWKKIEIGCSRSSRSTGAVDLCGPTKRSSTSSATRPTAAARRHARCSTDRREAAGR